MKRLAVLLLALFFLPLTAAAATLPHPVTAEELPEYVTDFISTYNSYADTFAIQPLPLDGWREHDNYSISIGDADFSFQGDSSSKSASIIIPSENADLDFIATCACLSSAVRGFSPDTYTDLMTVIIELRNTPLGKNAHIKLSGGSMVMTIRDDLLLFMVTKW